MNGIGVNDAVRDYVSRSFRLANNFRDKLREHVSAFLSEYNSEDRDASDVLYSLKAALLAHKEIDPSLLVPSHFLKSIKELYDRGNHKDVIRLSDRVLGNAEFLDSGVEQQTRYYLCLALARSHDPRFLEEVEKIRGPERNFLYGFYYRLNGNFERSIRNLRAALRDRPSFPRARNELARVYIYLEEYERGLQVAKPSYDYDPTNPYFIKTYFDCLVRLEQTPRRQRSLKQLLHDFTQLRSARRAEEMFLSAMSLYRAFYADDEAGALKLASQVEKYNSTSALFVRFAVCERYRRAEELERIVERLEQRGSREKTHLDTRFARMKAISLAISGDVTGSVEYVRVKLTRVYPRDSLEALIKKLSGYRTE